jgi:hypothetical protein
MPSPPLTRSRPLCGPAAAAWRAFRQRLHWVWRQDSAWADAATIAALGAWTAIDLGSGAGVTDRATFRMYGWIPDGLISLFTLGVTLGQAAALLTRSIPARAAAALLQGAFWATVSLTMLRAPTGVVGLTVCGPMVFWAFSWLSLVRVAQRYPAGG